MSIGRDIGRPLVTDLTLEGPDGTPLDSATFAPTRFGDLFGGAPRAFRSAPRWISDPRRVADGPTGVRTRLSPMGEPWTYRESPTSGGALSK